jgi:hypothetical protein
MRPPSPWRQYGGGNEPSVPQSPHAEKVLGYGLDMETATLDSNIHVEATECP